MAIKQSLQRFITAFTLIFGSIIMSLSSADAQSTREHPLEQMERSAHLFQQGNRKEATYLYYVGQLRMRVYLDARPDLKLDGEPALAASYFEVIGQMINEWAAGDLDFFVANIDRVLAWHAANDDRLTPKAQHARSHREVAQGLRELREYMDQNREEIRAQRQANGLPNR